MWAMGEYVGFAVGTLVGVQQENKSGRRQVQARPGPGVNPYCHATYLLRYVRFK